MTSPGDGIVLAVVVVNWNDAARSARAIRSADLAGADRLVLVDNGSTEDPTSTLRELDAPVELVELATNRGYGAGWNAGVRRARAAGSTHVLVLNNDAVVARDALDVLRSTLATRPGTIVAPLIVHADRPDVVWSAGGTVRPPMMRNHHRGLGSCLGAHTEAVEVSWASGCALAYAVDDHDLVGDVDETLFLYLEDVEWCLRARRLGIPTVVEPRAVVSHEVSASTGALPDGAVRYYAYRNLYRVAFRHAPLWARPVVAVELVWTLAKTAVRWTFFPRYRHDRVYHARTRAVRDVLLRRGGAAPEAYRDQLVPVPAVA